MAGKGFEPESIRVPIKKLQGQDYDFIDKLPPWEIINKYNLKSKYFDTDPYAGSNRIKVQVEPKYNSSTNHFDNIMAVFVDPDVQNTFISGQLISFQELTKSTDPNTSGATSTPETGITGTTNVGKSVTMTFANPTSPNLSNSTVTYNFPTVPNETKSYKFPTDIEYFQVITGVTYNDFVSQNAAYAKGTTTPIKDIEIKKDLENTKLTKEQVDKLAKAWHFRRERLVFGLRYQIQLHQQGK
mgnify:CR=1 FL=1